MQQVVVKVTPDNSVIDDQLKEYNLALTIDLSPLWQEIEEEAKYYGENTHLYIQVEYSIPIKSSLFKRNKQNAQMMATGGGTELVKFNDIGPDKQVIIQAVYAGAYDTNRTDEISTSAKIWMCQMENISSVEEGIILENNIQANPVNSSDQGNGKKNIRNLFNTRFFRNKSRPK